MKERLLHLIKEAEKAFPKDKPILDIEEFVADFLLANGVTVSSCNVGDTVYCIYVHYDYKRRNKKDGVSEFIPPSDTYLRDNINRCKLVVKTKKYVKSDEYKVGKYIFLTEQEALDEIARLTSY